MELQERQIGNVVVLDISGQLTLEDGSVRLKDKINSVLHEGSRNILLNLGDVSYIDSGGLGQLVSSFTSVTREHGRLKVAQRGQAVTGSARDDQARDGVRYVRYRARGGREFRRGDQPEPAVTARAEGRWIW